MVDALETDLAIQEGIDRLCATAQGRELDALLANAARGLGQAFLDQEFTEDL